MSTNFVFHGIRARQLLALFGCVFLTASCQKAPVDETALPERFVTPQGHEMVLVRAGEYRIGAQSGFALERGQSEGWGRILPPHSVRLDSFYVARHETSRDQYSAFLQDTSARRYGKTFAPEWKWGDSDIISNGVTPTGDHPVAFLVKNDAEAYADWVSDEEYLTFRLPTESEWEVSAAGGHSDYSYWEGPRRFYGISGVTTPYPLADPGDTTTLEVIDSGPQNSLGLYNVRGNALEWVRDGCGRIGGVEGKLLDNPVHGSILSSAMLKGGGQLPGKFFVSERYCRDASEPIGGIRLVCEVDQDLIGWLEKNPDRIVPPEDRTKMSVAEDDQFEPSLRLEAPGGTVLEFIEVAAPGVVLMGDDNAVRTLERPQMKVRVEHGWHIARLEVTQKLFEEVMGYNPAEDPDFWMPYYVNEYTVGDELPVHSLTRKEAEEFCVRMTAHLIESGQLEPGLEMRLPYEWEWEHTCRLASTGIENLEMRAHFDSNLGPLPPGSMMSDGLGLYDLLGNVAEICQNFPFSYLHDLEAQQQDVLPKIDSRVLSVARGGGWAYSGLVQTCSARFTFNFLESFTFVGFRPVIASTDSRIHR